MLRGVIPGEGYRQGCSRGGIDSPLDESLLVVLGLLQGDSVGLVLAEEGGRLEVLHRLLGVELQKRLPGGQSAHVHKVHCINTYVPAQHNAHV